MIRGTAWFAGTRLWAQGVSWVVTIILARLLTPDDYGLFAMALAAITLLELFQEFGLGVAIIQRRSLTRPQLNAIFWIIAAASAALLLIAAVVAPLAAAFYGDPRLVWMIRVLGAVFVLNSLGLVPDSLLTKEIDFRRRSLAEACGIVAAAIVSIGLAWSGQGVWALVAGHLARAAVRSAGLAIACRWRPGLEISLAEMGSVLAFGLRVAGSHVFATLSAVANVTIVGRLLGGPALGFYTMAEALGSNPFQKFTTAVINRLSLPVFSTLQDDPEALRRYFLKITKYLAVLALPMQIGLALVAPDLVPVLLSDKWRPIIGLVQVFSLGGILFVVPLPSAPLLTARGKAQVVLRLSALQAGALAIALVVGAQFGLAGVAVAWLVAFCAVRLVLLVVALRELGLALAPYVRVVLPAAVSVVPMIVAVLALQEAASIRSSLERLGAVVPTGAVAYLVSLALVDRGLSREVRGIAQTLWAGSRA